MKKDSWKTIKALFNTIIELPESEQESFLAENTKNDPELYQKLKEMLQADRSAASNITQVVSDNIEQLYSEKFSLNSGDKIGSYEVKRLIGQGGMGSVFEAQRIDNDFEQTVAIKIIQSQYLNQETLNRFQSERQILANLNHPNIAHLIDGGATDEGLPYLVMEYIEGIPILDYCKKHTLAIEQRIELFLQVCNAVSYAHQNLIVHRDIKPGNILVNNEGQVKLLDFGIAKVLEPESFSQDVVETRIETRLLSLENASPEQVLGNTITTQTDVYTLGNLLYQLLTEETLFQVEKKARIQLERAICETQPIKPSTIVTIENSIAQIGSIHNLKKSLKGDLDNITLKALQKNPDDRYTSVEHFADDVNRYLNNFPVQARPEKLSYQLIKFIKRNRWSVSFACLLLVTIVSSSIFLTIKSIQLEEERLKAVKQAQISEKTSDFLVDVFSASDPNKQDGNIPNALELLALGEDKINQLSTTPKIQSHMLETIGVVYLKMGEFSKSEKLLNKSLKLKQKLSSTTNIELIDNLVNLAEAQFEVSKFSEAEENLRKSLNIASKDPQIDKSKIIPAKNNLATILTWDGRLKEAFVLYSEVVNIAVEKYGEDSSQAGSAYSNLGYFLSVKGDTVKAISALKKGLRARRAAFGDMHLETAHSLNHLSFTLAKAGLFKEALPLAREGLKIRMNLYKTNHPELVTSLNNVSTILSHLNKHQEAEKFAKQSLVIAKALYPKPSFDLGATYYSLGSVFFRKGDFDQAIQMTQRALEIFAKILPENSHQLAFPLTQLGKIYLAKKNYQRALVNLQEAYNLRVKGLPKDNWMIAESSELIGLVLIEQKKIELGRPYLEKAYQGMKKAFGINDKRTLSIKKKLEETY